MHSLQTTFASAAGELAWEERLRTQFEARELAQAEQVLRAALIESGGEMMRLCREASLSAVEIHGWDELAEAVRHHEGEPITGATIAIGNEADLAFEKGTAHRPYLVLGLYTDDAWGWSSASVEDALAQCREESPEWAGWDEDIEAFLEIEGLDALNTALVHHKQRHFIREEAETTPAPLRYVEYVLGCWWRALRFHQAVAVQLDRDGLAGSVPVISGLIELRPEVISVHWPVVREVPSAKSLPVSATDGDAEDAEDAEDASPGLARFNLIQRGRLIEDPAEGPTGSVLRRRLESIEDHAEVAEAPGLMRRLLGRG